MLHFSQPFLRLGMRLFWISVLAPLALLMLLPWAAHAQASYPQRTDRQVNDFAGLLAPNDAQEVRVIADDLLHTQQIELVVVDYSLDQRV